MKCAASLRQIGNAMLMYSQDNHGYAPPAKLRNPVGNTSDSQYNLYGTNFDTYDNDRVTCYWTNFISKYITKTAIGNASNAGNASQQLSSVVWGCPAWDSYANATTGGINVTQTGYGMNGFPEFTASYPPLGKELGESSGAAL